MAILQQSSTLTSQEIKSRVRKGLINSGIAKQINERSSDLTENSKVVLERRYLSKDREGNILEDAEGMFIRVAKNLSEADLNYGATEEDRIRTEEEFADVMRCLEFLPNSPTIMNAGRELQQLSACFVLPVEDSLDSIFSMVKDTALIHKSGGGTGFSFSRVRPEGDVVGSTGGVASGPVSFINAFDAATDVVKQGGTRRGANMGILNVTHPDIVKFIRSKQDGKHLANFNISVAITEDFVDKVLKNEDYDLINPRTGQITGQLNAKEVFSLMTELAWETGDPGIVFMDRINRENPNPQLGTIESTNPCGEQPLLPYESCNLGSINLARMVCYTEEDTEVDWQRLSRVTKTAVHLLDNVIDMNNYPIHEIAEMSRTTRRIGVGVMGFSDLLVQLGIQYDSEEALTLGEEVMRIIQDEAYKASIELAETRGTFPSWEGSSYNQPGPDGRPILHMRNSAPVTIAPTGTISIIAGASSGIEPLFALSYVRNVMDNTRLIEGNPYFEAVARNEGFYTPELMEELTQTGSLERLDVPLWVKNLFRTSHDITPNWHVRMQAAFQRHTDNSVSKTINFPHSATISDVSEAYMLAYETGCKGITVYRDGSKSEQVLSTGETTKQSSDDPTISNIPRDRPREIHGITERVRTGHGNMYITINFDEQQRPFEVFGTLGKAGGCDSAQLEAISRLVSLALRSGINPEEVFNQLRGITCCPAWDDGTLVRSGPDAVALALERRLHPDSAVLPAPSTNSIQFDFTKDHQSNNHGTNGYQNQKCPDCNGDLHYQEGCAMCASCGWNKCE